MQHSTKTLAADRYWPWACFVALFLLALPLFPDPESDSPQYLNMAHGLIADVPRPFSGRVLVPAAARIIALISGRDVETGFATIALLAYAAIAFAVWKLTSHLRIDGRMTGLAWFLPSMLFCLAHPYSPDLLSILWVALILLAVDAGMPFAAAGLFVPAMLTRESLAVLGFVMIASYVLSRRFWQALAIFGAVIGGLWLAGRLSEGSASNIHEMNPIIYMVAKIPANFLGNLLGLNLWTNSFQWCDSPAFTIGLPHGVSLGKIREFGLCRPDGDGIVRGWLPYVSVFGTSFGILAALARPTVKAWQTIPEAARLSLIYGLAMFVLGPMSGKSVMRTTFYGWPAFLIAGPFLFQSFAMPFIRRSRLALLAALYVASAWAASAAISGRHLPAFLTDHLPSGSFNLIALLVGLAANAASFVVVRRRLANSDKE